MSDKKYLKLRHNTWYFQKRVPKAIDFYYDSKIIEKSLETGDIRIARERRDILLGQLRKQEQVWLAEATPNNKFRQYAYSGEDEHLFWFNVNT